MAHGSGRSILIVVARVRTVATMALAGVALAAVATAGNARPRLYTVAGTETCLERLSGAIVGLPPATPPATPVLFVYRTPPDHLVGGVPPLAGMLDVFRGHGLGAAYDSVGFVFFKNVRDAGRSQTTPLQGVLIRNVAVSSNGATGWRKALRGCLRSGPPGGATPAPKRSIPRASLATFTGYWGGHTRGLRITSGGRGHESLDSGCCVPLYEMTFQIVSVTGTLTRATATYRVTRFRHYRGGPTLHTGQVGKLLLRDGIVTNSLTQDYFCSDPAWSATGACGA